MSNGDLPRPRLTPAMTAWLDGLGTNRTATVQALSIVGAWAAGIDLAPVASDVRRLLGTPLAQSVHQALTTIHYDLNGTPTPRPSWRDLPVTAELALVLTRLQDVLAAPQCPPVDGAALPPSVAVSPRRPRRARVVAFTRSEQNAGDDTYGIDINNKDVAIPDATAVQPSRSVDTDTPVKRVAQAVDQAHTPASTRADQTSTRVTENPLVVLDAEPRSDGRTSMADDYRVTLIAPRAQAAAAMPETPPLTTDGDMLLEDRSPATDDSAHAASIESPAQELDSPDLVVIVPQPDADFDLGFAV